MDNKRPLNNIPDQQKTTQPAPLDKFDIQTDELISQSAQAPPMKVAKKGKKGVGVFFLVLLILGLAGFGGWSYWQWMQLQDQANQKQSQIDGLNSENAELKEANKEAAEPKELTDAEKKAADKTAIADVVTAKLHAPIKDKAVKLTVNVLKQGVEFAYVSAGPESGGGAAYILKKVEDQWTIVYSGQEKPTQEVIDTYSIPTEFQSGQ